MLGKQQYCTSVINRANHQNIDLNRFDIVFYSLSIFTDFHCQWIATDFYRLNTQDLRSSNQLNSNLVLRVFPLSNKAAAGEKTLAYSEIKRSLISAFHDAFIHAL